LASLYYGHLDNVPKLCAVLPTPATATYRQIASDKFFFYALKPLVSRTVCGLEGNLQETEQRVLEGRMEIIIPQYCHVETSEFRIYPEASRISQQALRRAEIPEELVK